MFAINSISPNFQAKISSSKLAQQKADRFFEVSKEVAQKTVEKFETPNVKDVFLSNFQPVNIIDCVVKQAPNEYAITSKKLAEQKGARLFQEV